MFVSDLRGVINTSLRSTTAPCPRLVCASWRWRLTTPSTSTETCEYTPPRSDWPGAVTDAPPPLSLSLSQVFRGRGFLRVPVGSGSRIRRSHPHQESWRRLQEDQGMLGLHPRGGGAGESPRCTSCADRKSVFILELSLSYSALLLKLFRLYKLYKNLFK